jgi:hypothetical protein
VDVGGDPDVVADVVRVHETHDIQQLSSETGMAIEAAPAVTVGYPSLRSRGVSAGSYAIDHDVQVGGAGAP